MRLTYLQNGRRVKDQMIALIHPMISSFGGAGPDDDQMPLSTYKGDVPMSEYIIPKRVGCCCGCYVRQLGGTIAYRVSGS